MKVICNDDIRQLQLPPALFVEWVRESFGLKKESLLPPKISLKPQGNDFFNTMPCVLPASYQRFGLKIVHRIAGAIPTLGSHILLYDSRHGDLLAMVDGDRITTMRTGAVATLAIQTLRRDGAQVYGMVGLGNTGRSTLLCLLESEPTVMHHVVLMRYKDQAERFAERFAAYQNVSFSITDSARELVSQSDVIVSCVTDARQLFCDDTELYRPGCTVVPVHSRGFQNCDTVFDKVFGDDTGHVQDFRYFNEFRSFAELSDVLDGTKPGRESADERILSYNIGLGLHDVLIADKIYARLKDCVGDVDMPKEQQKYYV